ncbi:MAG: hypothetical protein P1V36_00240 [Planctomycetota bacterium]|nr:hypothetical protein [Planctomycetota bacterium]
MKRDALMYLYTTLSAAQHYGRVSGNWTEEQDDVYTERLGDLWHKMDSEQRDILRDTVWELNSVEDEMARLAGRDPDEFMREYHS